MTRTTFSTLHRVVCALFSILSVMVVPAMANSASVQVIAVVDGKPITNIDFEERRHFLVKTTGINDTPEMREQIDKDVLQMLIDDVIKISEGLKFGGDVEASALQRANDLVNMSFSQNGENPDTVLEQLGISRDVAAKKFMADVLWASTLQSRFADQFAGARNEAIEELERIKANSRKPQINLDEIVLVPEPNRNYAETLNLASQIHNALKEGADFGRIAQQFSIAGSSQNGGKLGWSLLDRLPDPVRETVDNMETGSISQPVEIDGAVAIFRVNAIRRDGKADPLEAQIRVGRLLHPLPQNADEGTVNSVSVKITNDLAGRSNCDEISQIHQQYGSTSAFDLGTFKLTDVAPRLRSILAPLDAGQWTQPIRFSEGVVVFAICEKTLPTLVLPTIEEIEASIQNRHFSVLSSRYLSRLRRQAVIEYKERG
ncbi:peptidylprolyl isomerase [Alphaproteobacteria bacterium LSUCC0684]